MTYVSEPELFYALFPLINSHFEYIMRKECKVHTIFVKERTYCFGAANINSSAIVAAASIVARTLYFLASGKHASAINSIQINASLVEELLGCLLDCEPGLSCELVKQYISPSTTCPSHYVGVVLGEPSSAPYPPYAGDISRFVWNFLADKTSIPLKNINSSCPEDCNGVGELCIRAEADGKGVCVISTTRYF